MSEHRRGRPGLALRLLGASLLVLAGASAHAGAGSVELEALTSTELRGRVAAGATTVLVPVGGTEQSGAHIALGKHNARARALARRIAEELGQTIVAPVIAYVPEGAIDPPTQHMRFAGTISIPEPAFEATLAATARSLARHGFRDIVFLGDHGGYQASLERAAAAFNRGAGKGGARAFALRAYYRAAQEGYAAWLRARGYGAQEIGEHAGLADTALTLAIDPALVRSDRLGATPHEGVTGDPRRATAELGKAGVDQIVAASTAAVRAHLQASR
jgi:creatinine amidohydrolase/Fe(II)-dependent formamide hydrolase-like protein